MLDPKTGKYASSSLPASADGQGIYFPDAVVEPFVNEARRVVSQTFQAHLARPSEFELLKTGGPFIPEPRIPLEKSRELILEALNNFDPRLGKKAQEIFNAGFDKAAKKDFIEDVNSPVTEDDSRWRLRETAPGQARIMRCLPANSAANAYDPANPNPHAVIQYEHDGTINSTVYLAHELGHAIADDYINESPKSGENPKNLDEFQAYFIQNIVYDHLKKNPDPAIARAAQQHFTATMTQNLYNVPVALGAQAGNAGTIKACLGPEWEQYKPARDTADSLQALKSGQLSQSFKEAATQKLDDRINGLHSRPMGILLASGLATRLQGEDLETRRRVSETLLGRDGPTHINAILSEAGVESPADMGKLARETIRHATDGLSPKPAGQGTNPSI